MKKTPTDYIIDGAIWILGVGGFVILLLLMVMDVKLLVDLL